MQDEITKAIEHFASIYLGAVVGSTYQEAIAIAESEFTRFKYSVPEYGPYPDETCCYHMYTESYRYSDM
jgi:hypothetical protein